MLTLRVEGIALLAVVGRRHDDAGHGWRRGGGRRLGRGALSQVLRQQGHRVVITQLRQQGQRVVITQCFEVLPRISGASHCLSVVHLEEAVFGQVTLLVGLEVSQVFQLVLTKRFSVVARARKGLQLLNRQRPVHVNIKASKDLLQCRLQQVTQLVAVKERRLLVLLLGILFLRRHAPGCGFVSLTSWRRPRGHVATKSNKIYCSCGYYVATKGSKAKKKR